MTARIAFPAAATLLRNSLALAAGLLFFGNTALAGPDIQQWTASTGAHVQFVESRALPLVDIQIDFAAGSAVEPADKAGLAGLTLVSDPTFPAAVLDRERERAIAGLRESLTKPGTLAARSFNEVAYSGHPYGRNVTAESLATISRDDLVAFHRDHYAARYASVSIVGDVDRATAEEIAVRLTNRLPAGVDTAPLPAPVQPAAQTLRIAHPSAQAHIVIGQPGMAREDADYFPLLVGNYVLGGGGFVSRLTREVREKRGFAYSIYSYFAPQQVAGPFEIGLQTRGTQTTEALKVVNDTLNTFIAEGPTVAELQAAKDNLVNGFGLRLDSNRKILDYVAMIGFYQLPLDWLDRYPRAVAAVSREQVRDAFSRRIRPEHLVTIIAGGDGDVETTGNAGDKGR